MFTFSSNQLGVLDRAQGGGEKLSRISIFSVRDMQKTRQVANMKRKVVSHFIQFETYGRNSGQSHSHSDRLSHT